MSRVDPPGPVPSAGGSGLARPARHLPKHSSSHSTAQHSTTPRGGDENLQTPRRFVSGIRPDNVMD